MTDSAEELDKLWFITNVEPYPVSAGLDWCISSHYNVYPSYTPISMGLEKAFYSTEHEAMQAHIRIQQQQKVRGLLFLNKRHMPPEKQITSTYSLKAALTLFLYHLQIMELDNTISITDAPLFMQSLSDVLEYVNSVKIEGDSTKAIHLSILHRTGEETKI